MSNESDHLAGVGRVTGKGQVQIPKEIRDALGIRIGDELVFRLTDDSLSVHVRKRRRLSELAGALLPRRPFPGIDEEEKETKQAAIKRTVKGAKNGG
jgi:AbrB family looped-hinge helix DNA binding protein